MEYLHAAKPAWSGAVIVLKLADSIRYIKTSLPVRLLRAQMWRVLVDLVGFKPVRCTRINI